MEHRLTLPKAFGNGTLLGMLWDITNHGTQADRMISKSIVMMPFYFDIGFRTPKELALIASEAMNFIAWCERELEVTPEVYFT